VVRGEVALEHRGVGPLRVLELAGRLVEVEDEPAAPVDAVDRETS
jgi:hypothetical protein